MKTILEVIQKYQKKANELQENPKVPVGAHKYYADAAMQLGTIFAKD